MCFLYSLDRFSSNAAYIYVLVINRLSSLVQGVGIGKSSPLLCDLSWFLRPKGLVYEKSKPFDYTFWWYRERRWLQVFLIYVWNHKRFKISLFFWFFKSELLVKVALKTCTTKEYTRINNFSDSTTISIKFWFWLNEMGLYWVKCTFVWKKCTNVKETYVFIYYVYVRTVVIHLRKS